MATPHLTRNNNNPRTLNGITYSGNNHLLIVRNTATYNNVEMVATPVEEKFAAVAAWGDVTSYDTINANYMTQDINVILGDINNKIDSLNTSSWTNGHKNIFSYYARSGCPARCKWQPSTITAQIQQRYLEIAATRNILKFDLKHLPFGNFTSVKVYLRFWNPSFLLQLADGGSLGFNYAHNNTADILYSFHDNLVAPNKLTDGNYAYCRYTDNGFANEGNMSGNGTPCGNGSYDVWDIVGSVNASTYARAKTPYYYNAAESFSDHEITDANVLADLKSKVHKNRYVYLMLGPRIANGIASAQYTYGVAIGAKSCIYATRVELVFKVTGSPFNNR